MKKNQGWPIFNRRAYYHFYSFYRKFTYYIEVPGTSEDMPEKSYKSIIKLDQECCSYQFVTVVGLNMLDWWTCLCLADAFTDIRSAKEMTGAPSDGNLCESTSFTWKLRRTWPNIKDSKAAGKEIEPVNIWASMF